MNRVDFVKENFPKVVDSALQIKDPSNNNKYLLWIAQQLNKGHNKSDISSTVSFFHKNLPRFEVKDIYKYQDLKDLENIVKDMGISNRKTKEKQKEGGVKIFENDNFLLVRTDDKPSMMHYGANTRWCVTMKKASYFEEYIHEGHVFYVVIVKKTPKNVSLGKKYAIHREKRLQIDIYDERDRVLDEARKDEIDALSKNILPAVITDTPPINYINQITKKKISTEEAQKWLETQPKTTLDWVVSYRPDLRYFGKTIKQIASILSYDSIRTLPDNIQKDLIKFLSENKRKYSDVKYNLVSYGNLTQEDLLIFANDSNTNVKCKAIENLNYKYINQFLNVRAGAVFSVAIKRAKTADLLALFRKSKSKAKRRVLCKELLTRIPSTSLMESILNNFDDDQANKLFKINLEKKS